MPEQAPNLPFSAAVRTACASGKDIINLGIGQPISEPLSILSKQVSSMGMARNTPLWVAELRQTVSDDIKMRYQQDVSQSYPDFGNDVYRHDAAGGRTGDSNTNPAFPIYQWRLIIAGQQPYLMGLSQNALFTQKMCCRKSRTRPVLF